MTWEFVSDGIIVPNGRVLPSYPLGATGRMLVYFPQSDYEDTRLRGYAEFSSYQPDLAFESPLIAWYEIVGKAMIFTSPLVDSSVGFTISFPSRALPFGGQVYEIQREN